MLGRHSPDLGPSSPLASSLLPSVAGSAPFLPLLFDLILQLQPLFLQFQLEEKSFFMNPVRHNETQRACLLPNPGRTTQLLGQKQISRFSISRNDPEKSKRGHLQNQVFLPVFEGTVNSNRYPSWEVISSVCTYTRALMLHTRELLQSAPFQRQG